MKHRIKQEKGISMVALVITVIILVILTNVLIYNASDNVYIKSLTDLYNDISMLREKVSSYYNEYGKIPAKIEYKITDELSNELSSVLSTKNDTGKFYVIDLEAMQGITLNYGRDYEKVKNDIDNANNYTDLYIINENSHNIFYVQGITIKENNTIKIYYTDYIEPDETTIELRYVDKILIPEGYYYIGKTTDSSGNESIVISTIQGEKVDTSKTNQYTWTKQISELEKKPDSVTLEDDQKEYQFIKSVNTYKGYFKNFEGKVQYIVIDEEKWSEAYTKEIDYEDINGDKVTIPEGFRVSMSPTMNTVENGFVVKDSNDNEWVWIEVPKSVFTTATNNSDYENIKADLVKYAKDYREGKEGQGCYWTDEWYAMDGDTLVTANTAGLTDIQKALNNGCGLKYDEYQTAYQKMLSSIYTNGGFWISRYEIGDSTATDSNTTRTSNSGISGKAVSKPNQIPYNYVTCSQAQNLASRLTTDASKTSSLLFGIQWDLVCKFLEENSNLTKVDIKSDSTGWGNYKNSGLTLYRGKYNIDPENSTSIWTSYITSVQTSENESYMQLLTTGASEQTNKMNIYDFAGNEWEWTLEKTSYTSKPCTLMGGSFYDSSSGCPTSYRHIEITTGSYCNVGFRSALY